MKAFVKELFTSILATVIFAAAGFLFFATLVLAATREEETAACQDDAQRLCSQYIPDEANISACMRQQMRSLTPGCRAMFNPVAKQRHHHGNSF